MRKMSYGPQQPNMKFVRGPTEADLVDLDPLPATVPARAVLLQVIGVPWRGYWWHDRCD